MVQEESTGGDAAQQREIFLGVTVPEAVALGHLYEKLGSRKQKRS